MEKETEKPTNLYVEPITNLELINIGYFFRVVKIGIYPEYSVLAGQTSLTVLDHFKTQEAALAKYPDAEPCEYRIEVPPIYIPDVPPEWFDELEAGEHWNEEPDLPQPEFYPERGHLWDNKD